jgi:hypothetical protein
MANKTCKYCNKKRKVGVFYYENSLEANKEICVYCLISYYEKRNLASKVLKWIKKVNKIQLKQTKLL